MRTIIQKVMAVAFMLVAMTIQTSAQKKVAVVTMYGNKVVGFSELGIGNQILITKVANLSENPDFNLKPILKQFHDKIFNEYAKKFSFELLPENEVINDPNYISFTPKNENKENDLNNFLIYDGYKHIYDGPLGKKNEEGIANVFKDKADGVMFIQLYFDLVKGIGIGGTSTTKMKAYARISIYDKTGKKVVVLNEFAKSKKTGVMVKGVPVMTPKKILPMCESAMDNLMKDLEKKLPKLLNKVDKKL